MHLSTHFYGRFAVPVAIATVMATAAGCSGGTQAEGDVVSDSVSEGQATSAAADDSSSTTVTSIAAEVNDGPVIDFQPSAEPLAPARYRTATDVQFEFTIPDGER